MRPFVVVGGMSRHRPTTRRRVLGLLGFAVSGGGLGGVVGRAAGTPPDAFVFEQDDRCTAVVPVRGEQSAAAFYDWDEAATTYSSVGTTELQRDDTSLLFLYESPAGVYLVVVHGRLGGSDDGGSASFRIEGLPDSGTWVVRDDYYDGPSNYDRWSVQGDRIGIDWTWAVGRTDGGVFGPLGDAFDLAVYPAFNADAALDGQYYHGSVADWQVLSATPAGGVERRSLDMDRPVRLRTGACRGGPDDRTGSGPPATEEPPTEEPPTEEPGTSDPTTDGPLHIGVAVRRRTVNPSSRGVVPVDLNSTASTTVRRLALDSVRAGSAQAPPVRVRRLPGYADRVRAFFSVPDLGLTPDDTALHVTAVTADGDPVVGSGAVRVLDRPDNRRDDRDDRRGDSDERGRDRGQGRDDRPGGRGDRGRDRGKGRGDRAQGPKEDGPPSDEPPRRDHPRDDDGRDDDDDDREDRNDDEDEDDE